MKDKLTAERIQLLHPALRNEAVAMVEEFESRVNDPRTMLRFSETLRTYGQQEEYYKKGRTKPGMPCSCNKKSNPVGTCPKHPWGLPVTWAKPGQSAHQFGLAVDAFIMRDKNGDGKFEALETDFTTDYDKDGVADWQEWLTVLQIFGWEAGYLWAKPKQDPPHAQKMFGLSVYEMDRRYQNKILIPGTNYIKLTL